MMDMPEKQIIVGMDLAKGESFSAVHMPYEQYETLKRKADIATQLAEALEEIDKYFADMNHPAAKIARQAPSRYHRGKPEPKDQTMSYVMEACPKK